MAAAQPVRSGIDFSAFRDPKLARELIDRIHELVGNRSINLMEVCGTHTVSIGRYGFRSIMPTGLKLLSGPGCPVCVTANRDIDHAIALSNMDGAIITTFGDMMRVHRLLSARRTRHCRAKSRTPGHLYGRRL